MCVTGERQSFHLDVEAPRCLSVSPEKSILSQSRSLPPQRLSQGWPLTHGVAHISPVTDFSDPKGIPTHFLQVEDWMRAGVEDSLSPMAPRTWDPQPVS